MITLENPKMKTRLIPFVIVGAVAASAAQEAARWTEGNHTTVIAVSYWGDYTEGLANVLLNKIIVSLKIERGVGQGLRVGGATTTTPRAGVGQFDAMLKSLDTNGDGKITKEEADGAAWFGRVDQNNDGVLDAAELEGLRRGTGVRPGAINR